jgi:hypothetical protein
MALTLSRTHQETQKERVYQHERCLMGDASAMEEQLEICAECRPRVSWFTHKSGGFDLGEVYRVHTGEREARIEFKGGAFMVLTDEEDIARLLAKLSE